MGNMQDIVLKVLEVIIALYLLKLTSNNMGKKEKVLTIGLLVLITIDLILFFK